ncbi:MAG TPA: glycosyltransferase family 2 protein [Desulfotomaculum sp.]|nr:glycosyltransferase family 2 protein [Desulfotomaculum sp.]
MKRVSVIIPAYNEAARIGDTVSAAFRIPEVTEVIVIDDASTDRTGDLARKAGARVIRLLRNSGKGAALNRGVQAAAGEVIVLLDADLGESAQEARNFILPVLSGEVDMAVARFPSPKTKGGFGLVRTLAGRGIRFFTGLDMKAPLSGQRALSRETLSAVLPFAGGYGVEVALTIKAARRGFRIAEIPLPMRHRETGRNISGFLHRGRQFRDVLLTLGRFFLEYRGAGRVAGR